MSKRKPLSAEEKQLKLLELFHETNEVYQLKDLERLAPTEKGIVLQSVKSTLQELVDNGQVKCEKLLGSLYFWSFPSAHLQELQRELDDVESKTVNIQHRVEVAQEELLKSENSLKSLPEVDVVTREIDVLIKEKQALEMQMKPFKNELNSEEIKRKEHDSKTLLEAANRWTDNIFLTKTWCKRKFDKQDKELNKAFGIPEDLDYVNV